MIESSPLGRAATPDEVGSVGALLMGPDGGFITGSDILMDRGRDRRLLVRRARRSARLGRLDCGRFQASGSAVDGAPGAVRALGSSQISGARYPEEKYLANLEAPLTAPSPTALWSGATMGAQSGLL